MANDDNLIPLDRRTKAERREIARMGGKASGQARRAKKTMRELAELMLDSRATGAQRKSARSLGSSLDDDDLTNAAAVIAGQMRSAMKGNTQAARWLTELVGEMATQDAEDDELSKSLEELGKRL